MRFTEDNPFIAMLLFIGLLLFILHNIKKHYILLNSKENKDWYTILLLLLILIGIYGFFNTTTHIIKFGKKSIDKYKDIKKIKKDLKYEIDYEPQSDPKVLEMQLKQINKLDQEMKEIENGLLA